MLPKGLHIEAKRFPFTGRPLPEELPNKLASNVYYILRILFASPGAYASSLDCYYALLKPRCSLGNGAPRVRSRERTYVMYA